MPIPKSEAELTELFRQLGVDSPELWARSQIREGIPQLPRALFLKQAWERIQANSTAESVDEQIASCKRRPESPLAGLGRVLERCLAAGASREDLAQIMRAAGALTLFNVSYLIDGPASTPQALSDLDWGLFITDEHGKPSGPRISGLHESVFAFAPVDSDTK